MPFKSRSQQAYLYSQKPEVAEEFAQKTPESAYKNLPEHVDEKQGKREHMKALSKKYLRKKSVR